MRAWAFWVGLGFGKYYSGVFVMLYTHTGFNYEALNWASNTQSRSQSESAIEINSTPELLIPLQTMGKIMELK